MTSEPQNHSPVDRQVGEPVAWRTRGPNGGWMHSDNPPSSWRRPEPLALHADLEQVTRERDEAVAALEKIANPPYGLGFNRLRGLARQALASLRSMEKTGG